MTQKDSPAFNTKLLRRFINLMPMRMRGISAIIRSCAFRDAYFSSFSSNAEKAGETSGTGPSSDSCADRSQRGFFQMEPVYYVIAILGCTDGSTQCTPVATVP